MVARIRRWHGYLGVFIAPAIIFFALTGALQVFDLHESHGTYRSPIIIQQLASLHKDQQFEQDWSDQAPAADASRPKQDAQSTSSTPIASGIATSVLKWFFLVISLGLASSTSLGLWMGLRQSRRKILMWSLLAAGIILPAADVTVMSASDTQSMAPRR